MSMHMSRAGAVLASMLLLLTAVPVAAADAVATAPPVTSATTPATTAAPTPTTTPATATPTATTGTAVPTATQGTTADAIAAPVVTPAPAANQYSLNMTESKLSFVRNGSSVKSYSLNSNNVTLRINDRGQMVASFETTSGPAAVNLGDQRTVQLTGTYNTVTADPSLGGSVKLIADSGSNIANMVLKAPTEIHIYGVVGTASLQAAADVVVERGATVTTARMVNSRSLLTANGAVKTLEKTATSIVKGSGVVQTTGLSKSNLGSTSYSSLAGSSTSVARTLSGLKIDPSNTKITSVVGSRPSGTSGLKNSTSSSSSSSTTTTSGDIRLVASNIRTSYDVELRTLNRTLANNVKAYDRTSGKQIYGDVYWVKDEYTEVTSSGYYSFSFEADSGNYGEVTGRVYISTSGSSSNNDDDRSGRSYYFEIDRDGIDTGIHRDDREDYRLDDISESWIEDVVRAYDSKTDDEIDGDFEWVNPSRKLTSSSAQFRFIPDSSRYSKKTGSVKLVFDND